jgi:two-component system nitrate/nitrite sensor histidine kinase NarX
VLHVIQEALSNVRKHSQAKQVYLEVFKGEEWRFVVRDDGRGFDPEVSGRQNVHVGLKIMQERAMRIGAAVQVQSELGRGTTVQLSLPAHPVSGSNTGGLALGAEELAALQVLPE